MTGLIRGGILLGKAIKAGRKALKKRRKEKEDKELIKEFKARDAKEARQLKKLDDEANKKAREEIATPEYKRQRKRDLDATTLRMFRKSKENPTGAKNLEEAKQMAKETDDFVADTLSNKRKSDFRYKKGGKVKAKTKPKATKKFRGDGIAKRGKTKGRFV
tara:strand:+ start:690 stop:1172 length:483 start_codon:yes stop_codon:yes gene_type:complete